MDQGVGVGAALGGLRPPPGVQRLRCLVLLALPGRVDGPLHQPGRPQPPRGFQALHLGVDLLGTLGERPHQLPGHAADLAVAVPVGLGPRYPQRAGQLPLQRRPVDRIGRAPVPVDVPAVQRGPAAVGALDAVGHHQVGVDERVAFAAGAVVKPNRQQAVTHDMLRPAVATAGAELPIQVRDCFCQPNVVGVQHRFAGRGIPKAIQHRDALAGPQHQVKPCDGVAAMRAAKQLPRLGVAALDEPPELLLRGLTFKAEARGGLAVPAAWGLAVAGQVLLAVVGEPLQVVVLAAGRQLGHVQHHLRPPPAPRCASERTPGALLSCSKLIWR
jgi:hypothetical protein